MPEQFRLVIRTPREAVIDRDAEGIRIPTETGQVGLRPGGEPMMLVVEPGLIVVHTGEGTRLAATAGGLFESDRRHCILYTPFAVTGERDSELLDALDTALSMPDSELAARRRLGELEQRIVREIRHREPIASGVRA